MPSHHPFAPLRRRPVRILWLGAVISDIGTWIQLIVVGSLIAADTGSAVKTGLVALATFMPQGIAAPLGGLLADRYERRRVFATALIAQGAITSVLALALASGVRSPGVLSAIILCASAAGALGAPAYQAMLPDLVPAEELMAMVSLGIYSWNAGRIVGPLLGSALMLSVGPAWTIAANAASFALLAAAVATVRQRFVPSGEAGSVGERLTAGWQALRATPGCVHAIAVLVLFNLTVVPFMGLIPIYAARHFDGGTTLTGVMSSAQGIGAIAGGLAITFLARRHGRSRLTEGLVAYLALALAGYALAPNQPSVVVVAAVLGAGGAATFITISAIMQRDAPEASRGRVMALMQAAMGVSYGAGLLTIGVIGDATNLRIAFGLGAIGIVAGFALLTSRSRNWRRAIDGTPAASAPALAPI